jgi:sugar lactone lactonase YvrE
MPPPYTRAVKAELVSDARARLGEGPLWDARTQELLWVDILAGVVHRFDPDTGADRVFDAGGYVGAVVARASGGYALATAEGFALATEDGRVTPLAAVGHDEAIRMNDGACDSRGRFWAGSMRLDEAGGGGCLYRLDPDHSVTTICEGVTISNGIAWSPDDTLLYYVDTPTGTIDVFDFDAATGTALDRRVLVRTDGPGLPDGLVADAEGCLWVAFWGGAAVRRYAPDGELLDVVEVPAAHTTKAAFGGAALERLYITTAAGDEPHAGGLFVADPGVHGLPAPAYAG